MERWKTIPSFPNYEASSFGRIRRATPYQSTYAGRVLKPRDGGNGYLTIGLAPSANAKVKRCYVHRLVAEAFHGPCPHGHVVAHLNGMRADNRAENLCWATRKENEAHKELHGTKIQGERMWCASITDEDCRLMRAHVAFGATIAQTARTFQIGTSAAHRIVRGQSRRSAGGYL